MQNINRVLISGNMTRDPELRRTQSGMAVLSFGVAVNDSRRNQQTDEWEDYPNFIDCTMFGKRAESVSAYLRKGKKVYVEGKLRWSQWERDGQKRSKVEVVVDNIEWDRDQAQGGYQQEAPTQPQQPPMQQGYYAPQPAPVAAPQQQGGYQPPQGYQYKPQPQGYAQPQAAPVAQPQPAAQQPADQPVYDEDIPF